jgi:hypothetical protein
MNQRSIVATAVASACWLSLRSRTAPTRSLATADRHLPSVCVCVCVCVCLQAKHVDALLNEHHIYLTPDGRMAICGLQTATVPRSLSHSLSLSLFLSLSLSLSLPLCPAVSLCACLCLTLSLCLSVSLALSLPPFLSPGSWQPWTRSCAQIRCCVREVKRSYDAVCRDFSTDKMMELIQIHGQSVRRQGLELLCVRRYLIKSGPGLGDILTGKS